MSLSELFPKYNNSKPLSQQQKVDLARARASIDGGDYGLPQKPTPKKPDNGDVDDRGFPTCDHFA